FFVQAEDGIRVPLVTGVQTCALPISSRSMGGRRGGRSSSVSAWGSSTSRCLCGPCTAGESSRVGTTPGQRDARAAPNSKEGRQRTEERSVGKEGSKRKWARDVQR